MSIELEPEEVGRIRVRVDAEGVRAVSHVMDPIELITQVCETMDIECLTSDGQMTILVPAEPSREPDQVEEAVPEEGESAQEDDNV